MHFNSNLKVRKLFFGGINVLPQVNVYLLMCMPPIFSVCAQIEIRGSVRLIGSGRPQMAWNCSIRFTS
jgi:hypothetical protein